MEAVLIYNLFPRLAGSLDQWPDHAMRARDMGFNWIYLNPVTYPGFSGSLYAVKDYYRLCPDFLPAGSSPSGIDELGGVLEKFRSLGLKTAMDLVINHTAVDSPLVAEHPDWFARDPDGQVANPSAIDPADARNVTVWGDLAEIDNAASPDRDNLWNYWKDLTSFYLELGFQGFRCDAAYKVPAELWRELAGEARRVNPQATFFAETLGCRIEEVESLEDAGLDYLFNSSKYWNFDAPWALEQHESFGAIRPSVSFPESHDTPRLMAEVDGNLAAVRQRYLLAAVFSAGLMMPIGFEFGFRKPLHVVESTPDDWEETGVDLSGFIRGVNRLKSDIPVLGVEGHFRPLMPYDRPVFALEKTHGSDRLQVLINKDWSQSQTFQSDQIELFPNAGLCRVTPDGEIHKASLSGEVLLEPAEIALVF